MFYKFQIKYIFTKKNSNEKNLHLVIKKQVSFFLFCLFLNLNHWSTLTTFVEAKDLLLYI